ncbi:MAG: MgtC/SapB family protein [Candidatus Omnitrophica bacterium]|nr:MgtC/SapB family protein [Candidatus Omnitrophota bacterium]
MLSLFDTIVRLSLAFVFGGVIGLEREKRGKHPGLRTHILVCVGSALIMLVSIYVFQAYQDIAQIDPGRIAAGVVTGIGFLGAGTIIRNPQGIRGLTTAGSVWINAAIGLAAGCGYISGALFATIIAYVTLSYVKRAEEKAHNKSN